jgi:hypothetical protein
MRGVIGLCLGLVLGFVLALVSLVLKGCGGTIEIALPLAGCSTRLEAPDAVRALLWPADERGQGFRFIVEGPGHWDQREKPPGTIGMPPTSDAVRRHFTGLGAATVLLPVDADSDLRRRARVLL